MVVSTGLVVVSVCVDIPVGFEVTTVVTGLVVGAGTEVSVSRLTVVEAVIGPVSKLLDGFVVGIVVFGWCLLLDLFFMLVAF